MKKKISIITTCRNDDYIVNFIDRLQYTINFFFRNSEEIGRLKDLEFIIVDWGSKETISSKFSCLKKSYQKKIKFLEIDSKSAYKFSKNVDGGFFTEKAINFGISKSQGDYILYLTADALLSKNSIKNIFDLIDNKKNQEKFFLIPRKYIDLDFFLSNPDFSEMDRYLENIFFSKIGFSNTQFQNGGGAVGWFVKKKNYKKINGLDENALSKGYYSGSDADLLKNMSIYFDHCDASNFGITGFKLPRANFKGRKSLQKLKKPFAYSIDDKRKNNFINRNLNSKIKFSKKILKNINIGNKGLENKHNKIYNLLRIYWHTLFNKERLTDFHINLNLINFINKYKTQNFFNFGLNKLNRIASISKIYPYINLYSFDIQSRDNNYLKTSSYLQLNRYLNRTHNGYYRFLLTSNIKNILDFLQKKQLKKNSSIVNIDVSQFKISELKKIIEILHKENTKILKIIFENTKFEEKKIINHSKILNNYELSFSKFKYLILVKKNYEKIIKNQNFFNIGMLSNSMIVFLVISMSVLKRIILKLNFFK